MAHTININLEKTQSRGKLDVHSVHKFDARGGHLSICLLFDFSWSPNLSIFCRTSQL